MVASSSWLRIRAFVLCLQLLGWNFCTPTRVSAQAQDTAANKLAFAHPMRSDVLAAGDEITLSELDVEEFNDKSFQVATDGTLGLPLVGRIRAIGEAEQTLAEADRPPTFAVMVARPK